MHPILLKARTILEKSWKYDLVFAVGVGIGAAAGWIFCKKKLQDEYTKAVDKQVEAYKNKVRKKTQEIVAPLIPAENEEMTVDEAKAKVEGGNFQTSSLEGFKPTPEGEQRQYHKMYKNPYKMEDMMPDANPFSTPEEAMKEAVKKMGEEEFVQVVDAAESQKLNDIPRTPSGRIMRGSRPASMEDYEDTPAEDRVHLCWYEEDDILADPDGDIWDEDDAFGDDLANWKTKDEEDIVKYSNYYADKVFLIEKKHCSYSDIYDGNLDDYLYDED